MSMTVGIDVHKATLMIATSQDRPWEVANTPKGRAALLRQLQTMAPERIVLEPSGGYERALLAELHAAGLPACRVNGQHVRAFAHAHKRRAKTDRIDAQVLAAYGATMRPELTPEPDACTVALAALSARRRQLTDTMAAEQCRRDTCDPRLHLSIDRHLAFLAAEVTALDTERDTLIAQDAGLQRKVDILVSVPGIGPTTAALLLAALPELGTRPRGTIAALAGVAPFDAASGMTRRHAAIAGGRERVRTGLFMPTRSAMRHNPVLAAFAARLKQTNKPDRVRVIACMHKLLTILNAMIARDETWQPRPLAP